MDIPNTDVNGHALPFQGQTEGDKAMDIPNTDVKGHALPFEGQTEGDEAGQAQGDEEERHHVDLHEAVEVDDDVHHLPVRQQDVVTTVPAQCRVHHDVIRCVRTKDTMTSVVVQGQHKAYDDVIHCIRIVQSTR